MKWLYWLSAGSVFVTVVLFAFATYNRLLDSDRVTNNIAKRLIEHKEALLQGDGFIYEQNALPNEVSVLVFDQERLVNWSSYYHFPDFSSLGLAGDTILFQDENVYLVSNRVEGNYKYLAISTLKRSYSLINENLPSFYNPDIFGDREVLIGEGDSCFSMPSGTTIPYESISAEYELTDVSLFLSVLILTVTIFSLLIHKGAILTLLFTIVAGLAFSYFHQELSWKLIYGLLLVWLWVLRLIRSGINQHFAKLLWKLTRAKYLAFVFYLIAGCGLTTGYLYFFRFLAENVSYGLDISLSLGFELRQLTWYVLLVASGLLLIVFINLMARLLSKISLPSSHKLFLVLVSISPYLMLFENGLYAALVFSIFIVVESFFVLSHSIKGFSYLTFFYALVLIVMVSSLNAIAIYKNDESRETVRKREFANAVLRPESKSMSKRLEEAKNKIEEDPNIRTRFLSPHLSKSLVDGSIRRDYLRDFLQEYVVDIYLFDGTGKSLLRGGLNFENVIHNYTNIDANGGVQFVENWENLGRSKYVFAATMKNQESVIGLVLVELLQKKVVPKTVYPTLLNGGEETPYSYDYALFKNSELVFSRGNYSFDFFNDPENWQYLINSKEGIETDGYHLLAVKSGDDIVIVISGLYSTRAILANFSFHFLLYLSFLGLFFLLVRRFITPNYGLSLANRIQLYLGASFILPLLVVSAVILNLLNVSYQEEIQRNYEKRCAAVAENIYSPLIDYMDNKINRNELFEVVNEASSFIRADLNLFRENGFLLVTSQPGIYRQEIISRRINPGALAMVEEKPEQTNVFDEKIGGLDFKAVYSGVLDHRTGDLLAVISIPFFESKNHLNRQQLEVFGNLVIVFTIIFLISVLVGYFVLRNITYPITAISMRLRATNLDQTNEPISYDGQDEIGELVSDYNLMLEKLEASKEALAQSQKETAWKEIARQVAHEIKNPLTPMRLKLQQVMRKLDDTSSENSKMLSSLLIQIDTLSEIADSFSAFAQMPAPNNENLNVSSLVEEACDLYSSKDVTIHRDIEPDLEVFADVKLLNRVLNNLILNGIQAHSEGDIAVMNISVLSEGKKVRIEVRDSGTGISEEFKHKVFTPYFSTKEKGSGIGLAVAKKGIEQAGGSIWFESELGKGTTFTILLPKVFS